MRGPATSSSTRRCLGRGWELDCSASSACSEWGWRRYIGIVNAGTSGNRILADNNSGLARLLHDALTVPGVRWLTLMEGINDITGATRANTPFSADQLIAA